jgi:hypothetical protein
MANDAFVPRPFPPPSLVGIPLEYVITQLRSFAPHYWSHPQTADCSIIIPISRTKNPRNVPSASVPETLERRHTEPDLRSQHLRFSLHTDYLSTHSTFLRELFSGASAIDLINTTSAKSHSATSDNRRPLLLPSPSNHPVLYLPVPDSASIPLLFHWIYFGEIDLIRQALEEGSLEWEGLARNAEYLGLSQEMKVFLYAWWHKRILCQGWEDVEDSGVDSDDEEETSEEDEDDEDISDLEMETCMPCEEPTKCTLARGRTRTVRLLSASMRQSMFNHSD